MLHRFDRFSELDGRKLMDLYGESNRENAEDFYPDADAAVGTARVEESFLAFLRDEFLPKPENTYWVWEEDGVYLCALRLTEFNDRLFYLEALETHPAFRRRGCSEKLFSAVIDALKPGGPFRICDCVSKRNVPSIAAHQKAGFRIVSDSGYDYPGQTSKDHEYSFAYRYDGK